MQTNVRARSALHTQIYLHYSRMALKKPLILFSETHKIILKKSVKMHRNNELKCGFLKCLDNTGFYRMTRANLKGDTKIVPNVPLIAESWTPR